MNYSYIQSNGMNSTRRQSGGTCGLRQCPRSRERTIYMIELNIHHDEGSVKSLAVTDNSTVEQLLKAIEAEGILLAELEEEILFLVEEDVKLLRREHQLHDHGFRHGHRIHIGKAKHILVEVVTTSGTWPHHGYENVPTHQPVKHQLDKAAKKLGLTDTAAWVAKVNGNEIEINKNYAENHLKCKVAIDYGPRAGGGGNE